MFEMLYARSQTVATMVKRKADDEVTASKKRQKGVDPVSSLSSFQTEVVKLTFVFQADFQDHSEHAQTTGKCPSQARSSTRISQDLIQVIKEALKSVDFCEQHDSKTQSKLMKLVKKLDPITETGNASVTADAPQTASLVQVKEAAATGLPSPTGHYSPLNGCPSLPIISDPVLQDVVFTHNSLNDGKQAAEMQRLEFFGDACLEIIATRLLYDRYTTGDQGILSHVRSELVRNSTLAKIARQYGFDKMIKIDDNAWRGMRPDARDKALGDAVEAYIGAVVRSDPSHGMERVSTWLAELWEDTLRRDHDNRDVYDTKAKVKLSQKLVSTGISLEYTEERPPEINKTTGTEIYHMQVLLTGWGHTKLKLGSASGASKKEGGMRAAMSALSRDVLINELNAMKVASDKSRLEKKEKMLSCSK
jgi:ribonuclease III